MTKAERLARKAGNARRRALAIAMDRTPKPNSNTTRRRQVAERGVAVGQAMHAIDQEILRAGGVPENLQAAAAPHLPAAPSCPEDCRMCSGEYCNTHGVEPCTCDVVARHAEPPATVHLEVSPELRQRMAKVLDREPWEGV